jgi:hypothetical protein
MTTIEDELRAVLDGFSEHGAPVTDRSAAVNARIQRHQRVRAAGLAAVLVIAIAITGGVMSAGWLHTTRHSAPPAGPIYEPAPKPGHLANYDDGGKLVASAMAVMPGQTTISMTYTPMSWEFMIVDACAAPGNVLLALFVNGKPMVGAQCGPDGGVTTSHGGDWDTHETYWAALGVRLGEPMTLSATIGADPAHDLTKIIPTTDPGIASIGIYLPVPWNEYHFPAKPTDGPQQLSQMYVDLPHSIARLTGGVTSTTITLPARIQMTASTLAPGLISIYLNDVKIDECDTYTYDSGCGGLVQDVGKGRLAGFTAGEKVTLRVDVSHFPTSSDWQMTLAGS